MSADVLDTGSRAVYVSSLESAVYRERLSFIYSSVQQYHQILQLKMEVCVCLLLIHIFSSTFSLPLPTENRRKLLKCVKTHQINNKILKGKKKYFFLENKIKFADILNLLKKKKIVSRQTSFTSYTR